MTEDSGRSNPSYYKNTELGIVIRLKTAAPVSYTHLDVYKRQRGCRGQVLEVSKNSVYTIVEKAGILGVNTAQI